MNFQDALNTKISDIEKPPLQPHGTYKWVVSKVPTIDESNPNWGYMDFPLKCLGATEDVDQDGLKAFGNLQNVFQRLRFLFNRNDDIEFKKTEHRVRRFLEDTLKIDGVADMALKEGLARSVNHQFLAQIVWTPDREDKETIHANIGKFAPLP